jgi:hypothetical protein
MLKIANLSQQSMKWTQPSMLKMAYELRSDNELVATLTFRNSWGTPATAESGDGCWTFKRVGFWQNRSAVRRCDSDFDLAIFKNNTWTNGGTLEFSEGSQFKATTNFWMTNYEFQSNTEDTLVRFKYGGVFKLSSELEITPAASDLEQLPVLVTFGWYLVVMLYMDSASRNAATT